MNEHKTPYFYPFRLQKLFRSLEMLNPKDAKLLAAKFFTLARNFDEIEGWPVDLALELPRPVWRLVTTDRVMV